MTHDELLAQIEVHQNEFSPLSTDVTAWDALRVVVGLANKQLETKDIPAEQVGWFNEGYNLAMDNIIDAIEKELG